MDPVTALFILILFFGLMRRSKQKKVVIEQAVTPTGVYPYDRRRALVSSTEKTFYSLLQSIVGSKFEIYVKVAMEELIEVKKNISASARPGYLNKIRVKAADFVLCAPNSLDIKCVILLDDNRNSDNAEANKFVDSAFKAAGLPLVHFKLNYQYEKKEIFTVLQNALAPAVEKEQPAAAPVERTLNAT